jgi:hypothetical protein
MRASLIPYVAVHRLDREFVFSTSFLRKYGRSGPSDGLPQSALAARPRTFNRLQNFERTGMARRSRPGVIDLSDRGVCGQTEADGAPRPPPPEPIASSTGLTLRFLYEQSEPEDERTTRLPPARAHLLAPDARKAERSGCGAHRLRRGAERDARGTPAEALSRAPSSSPGASPGHPPAPHLLNSRKSPRETGLFSVPDAALFLSPPSCRGF